MLTLHETVPSLFAHSRTTDLCYLFEMLPCLATYRTPSSCQPMALRRKLLPKAMNAARSRLSLP